MKSESEVAQLCLTLSDPMDWSPSGSSIHGIFQASGITLNAPTFTFWGPRGEEREKGLEKIFEEIIAGNFPNMGKEIVSQVQEAQSVLGRINPRRTHQDT